MHELENLREELRGLEEEVALHKARLLYKQIKELLKPVVSKIELVGSAARLHPIVNDIDIVATPKKDIKSFLESRKISVSSGKEKAVMFTFKEVPINIWLTPAESFGATVLHFSSGKGIIQIKRLAIAKGLKLNRYGLFKGSRRLAGEDYNEILRIVGTSTKWAKIKILEKVVEKCDDPKRFAKEGQFPRITENYYRFRQADPDNFKQSSFRIVKGASGNARVIGRTRNGESRTQSILIAKANLSDQDIREFLSLVMKVKPGTITEAINRPKPHHYRMTRTPMSSELKKLSCPTCQKIGTIKFDTHPHAQGWKDYEHLTCKYCKSRFTIK